ncbi:MAG TPA: IPT/TIG domain-containing protein, partial [Haliangiales bacterium]|nr:IPT/TIG domain-containing protein [Haliangiales bacterium]
MSPDAALPPDGPTLLPLRVDFLDPDHGPFVGGTQATLKGKGFAPGMVVTIGGRNVDATDVDVLDGA